MANEPTGTSAGKADWRGQIESERPVHHRWQQSASTAPGLSNGRLKFALKTSVWLLLAIAASAAFAWMMKFQPRQTPVVTLIFTRYQAPLFPNAWAFEDREALEPFNGVTLQLYDITDQGNHSNEILREFQRTIKTAAAEFHDSEPLIVYLSGHAGVDADGAACLLTSASSLSDLSTWLPIKALLTAANEARSDRRQPILFLLDHHRFETRLDALTHSDQFHPQLEQLVTEAQIPNLTVLTACSAGQQAYATAEHRQTVFGYSLQQALGGAADRRPHGNADRSVSFRELTSYLQQDVAQYSATAFGRTQTVQVLPMSRLKETDYAISWVAPDINRPPTVPVVTDTPVNVEELWDAFETAAQNTPFNSAPKTWGQIESDLLRLQQMVNAGAAYQVSAVTLADQLNRNLQTIMANTTAAPVDDASDTSSAPDGDLTFTAPLREAVSQSELTARVAKLNTAGKGALNSSLQLANLMIGNPNAEFWQQPGLTSLALETRAAADQAARWTGAETLPWIRAAVRDADEVRLQAEDEMFAGADASDRFRTAVQQYKAITERRQQTTAALNARNRALAELLWYSRLYAFGDGQQELDQLAERTALLSLALQTDDDRHNSAKSLPFHTADQDVRTSLNLLQQRLNTEYRTLLQQHATTAATIVRMQQLLSSPLLPSPDPDSGESGAAQRRRLQRRRHESVTRRLANADLAADTVPPPTNAERPWVQVVTKLAAALHTSSETDSGLRSIVQRLPTDVHTAVASTETNVQDFRHPLQQYGGRLRVLAPLALFSESADAVKALQRLDHTLAQIWRAERTLHDFYGPAQVGDAPFFAKKARHELQQSQTNGKASAAVQNRILEAGRLLNRRLQAATDGLQVKAHSILLMDRTQLEPMKIQVRATDHLPIDGLPQAVAAVYLADDQNQRLSNLLSLPVDQGGTNSIRSLTGELSVQHTDKELPPQLAATVNLRGNLFRKTILVSRAVGPSVHQDIATTDRVSVNVQGAAAADTSAIVILDCSQSMSEKIAAEAPGSQVTRFQAARLALLNLMEQMSDLDGFRVGLMLFGHRVGWNPDQPAQLLTQDDYLNGVPAGLRPFADVESVLPVGRFDEGVLQSLQPTLQSVRPWGETPLYLALTDALEELATEDPRRTRRIIVITDGTNQQVNPTPALRRTLNNVLQALTTGVSIDIVGFRIARSDAALATREFETLTSKSGGQFISVTQVDELMRSLSGLIKQEDYELTLPGGTVQVAPPGTAIPFKVEQRPATVSVRLADAVQPLKLYGGEIVDLQLSNDRRALTLTAQQQTDVRVVPLHHESGSKSPLQCAVGQLQLEKQAVEFRCRLQHEAGQFLVRPAAAQALIYPLDDAQQRLGPGYVADITAWDIRTANPEFQLLLKRWPIEAKRAEVQVQVQQQQTAPIDSIPLIDLQEDGNLRTAKKVLDNVNGISVFVMASKDLSRISVVQKHDAASPGLDRLIVRLNSSAALQHRLRRTDAAQRLVVTEFEYRSQQPPGLANSTIQFILQDDLQSTALRFENPVRLPVSVSDGLLLPTVR